ncbi:MAG: F0F1 ATP synthase subunit epsilon [Candidatus Gastranaerophilales bacterium]|nr:F0F1 ATP synthase subunit epsilon [Candidatus Gastranaerophilales bacterium]
MAEKKIHIKIITHDKIVYEDDVDAIYTKGVDGEFGILFDHTPLMSALDIGVTRVEKESKIEFISTMGGVFQFKNNEAVILTEAAERGQDIDVTRAQHAKERAEARIDNINEKIDAERANIALAKAMARLKAALNK